LGEQVDFWEFALEPANQRSMEVIVEGARLFVEELNTRAMSNRSVTGPKRIVFAHVEPYPFDTFSVIVYFRTEEGTNFSLNLEDIRFSGQSFSATARVYAWREINGEREFLIKENEYLGETFLKRTLEALRPEAVYQLYLKMYYSIASRFGLQPLTA